MKRRITYRRDFGTRGLDLEDLQQIINDANALDASLWTTPVVVIDAVSSQTTRVGRIREVRIEESL